ncbi:MAG: ABC transporter permease [Negativicutes bacterium]
MGILTVIRRELRMMFIDEPKIAAILFGVPVLYVILFGMVYSTNVVKLIPTVVYDQNQTEVSRTLIQAFEDSERFRIVAYTSSQEEMDFILQQETAQAAVVIPPDFSRDIKKGSATQVLLIVNGNNLLFANPAVGSAQEIVQTFSAGAGQQLMEKTGQLPSMALGSAAPVRFGLRVLNNPTYGYANFIIGGLGANGLQLGIVLAICTTLIGVYRREKDWRDISSGRIVIGKLLPYWMWGMVSFATYLVIAYQFLLLPVKGNPGELLLIGSAFVFAVSAIGLFFSAIAPNEVQAVQLPIAYIMPAFLFSGYIWPDFAMNTFSQLVSTILPLTYAAVNIRDLMLVGCAPDLYRGVLVLSAMGGVLLSFSVGIVAFRRRRLRLKEHQPGMEGTK